MKQLVQNFKTGELKLIEVPPPLVAPGGVLVRNVDSVVSVGTEKLMLEFAQKSLVGKALARPDLTRQVIDYARNEGLLKAYQQATSRLDNLTPLGYSCAGIAIEVGEGISDIAAGDRVACARGGFASHAEIVSVPRNLTAKIPDNVDFESAAFATVGAIALHAVRLCELHLGDRVAIIGLGLLGQLAVQIAKAAGYRVFGTDGDPQKTSLARELGAHEVAITGKDDVIGCARSFAEGQGVDAVIILASTSSNEPLQSAAEMCRLKGKIVVPGMVNLDVPRDLFYQKELSLIVSKGLGPGFDDLDFELRGRDYPRAYVPWTERGNMEEFLRLVSEGSVRIAPLITHRFSIAEAESAYKTMTEDRTGKYVGVLLSYDSEPQPLNRRVALKTTPEGEPRKGKVNVGLIGAGVFAKGTILPVIRNLPSVNLRGLATVTGPTGKHAGDKFGFEYCTTDYKELLNDASIGCVLIATRHGLHARFTAEALAAGKDVFVEKPLAMTVTELADVVKAHESSGKRLMVGFNRRFSPFARTAKEFLAQTNEPLVINCRVNAGFIPKESWVHDPKQGGGRILGEVCHFVDLAQFLTGSLPKRVHAESLRNTGVYGPDENVIVTISFEDGSIASVSYTANGDKSFPRERVEIFGGGSVCVIDNYRSLTFVGGRRRKKVRRFTRDLGYKSEFAAFFSAVGSGGKMPVNFEEYMYTTLATFAIEQSLRDGRPIEVDPAQIEGLRS